MKGDGSGVTTEITGNSNGNLNQFITMQFDSYNSSTKIINEVTVSIIYSMQGGNTKQTVDLALEYTDTNGVLQEKTEQIKFDTTGNNITKTVTFTGLNIPTSTTFNVHTHTYSVNNGKPNVTSMTMSANFAS